MRAQSTIRALTPALTPAALAGLLLLIACDDTSGPSQTLSIVSGSENRTLEPLIATYCADQGWSCPMT